MAKYDFSKDKPNVHFFTFKNHNGTVDEHGYVLWAGCGFHLEDVRGEIREYLEARLEKYKLYSLDDLRKEKEVKDETC